MGGVSQTGKIQDRHVIASNAKHVYVGTSAPLTPLQANSYFLGFNGFTFCTWKKPKALTHDVFTFPQCSRSQTVNVTKVTNWPQPKLDLKGNGDHIGQENLPSLPSQHQVMPAQGCSSLGRMTSIQIYIYVPSRQGKKWLLSLDFAKEHLHVCSLTASNIWNMAVNYWKIVLQHSQWLKYKSENSCHEAHICQL